MSTVAILESKGNLLFYIDLLILAMWTKTQHWTEILGMHDFLTTILSV